MTALEQLMPTSHFAERHRRDVAGSPEQAYAAARAFTLAEIPLARALFTIRGLAAGHGRLVGDIRQPLLAQMTARGFTVLAERPGREFVAGAIGQPWRLRGGRTVPVPDAEAFVDFRGPGFVKMAMSFRMEARGARTRVSTETRVLATDTRSRRAFAVYWLPVRIGSGLIRRAMLRAIARRTAMAAATATSPTGYRT